MIYITRCGDSAYSLAREWGMNNYNQFGNNIVSDNLGIHVTGGYYRPNQVIWLPLNIYSDDQSEFLRKYALPKLKRLSGYSIQNIARLQDAGTSVDKLIHVSKKSQQFNKIHNEEPVRSNKITASIAASTSVEFSARVSERIESRADKTIEHLKGLNRATTTWLKNPHSREAKELLDKHYKLANQYLNKAPEAHIKRAKIKDIRKYKRLARKGITVNDMVDVEHLHKVSMYGRMAGRAFFASAICLDADEVYETYKEGGDYGAKAAGLGLTTGAVYVAGEVLLAFTPAGWVSLIAVAAIETGVFSLGGHWIENKFENGYDWCRNRIIKWL